MATSTPTKRGTYAKGSPARAQLRGDIAHFSHSTVSDKRELFWQRHLFSFRLPAIAKATATVLLRRWRGPPKQRRRTQVPSVSR